VSKDYSQFYGRDVDVVSGPHQGRSGRVLMIQDIEIDGRDPEGYAIVEYREKNCFDETQTDQISVPIRRLSLRS
jgi:hypothetical protein